MKNEAKKTLNSLLCGIPILLASVLPTKEANGQMIKSPDKFFSSKYADLPKTEIDNKNSLYLVIQPCDLGFGVRYDRRISSKFGAYSSLSKGNYKFGEGEYINDHVKVALGGLFYLREGFDGSQGFLSGGISHHTYGEKAYFPGTINEKAFKPLSAEVGGGINVGNIRGAIRFDMFKKEGSWDLGFSF